MIFAVYDKKTREVLRFGQCAEDAFQAQARAENEAVVQLARLPNPMRAYVLSEDGALIDKGLSHLGWMAGQKE